MADARIELTALIDGNTLIIRITDLEEKAEYDVHVDRKSYVAKTKYLTLAKENYK